MLSLAKNLFGEKFRKEIKIACYELKSSEERIELQAMLLASIGSFLASAFFFSGVGKILLFGACFLFLYLLTIYAVILFAESRQRKKAISSIDAMLYASLYQNLSTTRIMEKISKSKLAISEEFKKALSEIKKGASIEEALENIKNRVPKEEVIILVKVLHMHTTAGIKESEIFRKIAEIQIRKKEIENERASQLLIAKATVVISAALITPITLGITLNFVGSFDFSGLADFLGSAPLDREIIEESITLYLAESSLVSALFLSLLEKNLKKAVFYWLLIFGSAIAMFSIAKGLEMI